MGPSWLNAITETEQDRAEETRKYKQSRKPMSGTTRPHQTKHNHRRSDYTRTDSLHSPVRASALERAVLRTGHDIFLPNSSRPIFMFFVNCKISTIDGTMSKRTNQMWQKFFWFPLFHCCPLFNLFSVLSIAPLQVTWRSHSRWLSPRKPLLQ
jgi:hypothetical protein